MSLPKLIDIKGIGKKRSATIETKMQDNKLSLADVYAMSPPKIKEIFGLPINVAETIADIGTSVVVTPQESTPKKKEKKEIPSVNNKVSEIDVKILQKSDDDYPIKLINLLGENAPEKLYIWGNLDLLNKPAVGFCGSRNVSDKGLAVTKDVTEQISDLGWVTVSGHARGVDSTAHRVALENNAGTIIVLPQGLEGFKLRTELKKYAKRDNLLIISEFDLDAGWAVGRAMQRNRTIIGLSDAMVLVESREKGGTFSAGKTALKYNHPLFVVDFKEQEDSNAGNKFFIQKGAIRLSKSRITNRANINPLQETVANKSIRPQAIPQKQLDLFETE